MFGRISCGWELAVQSFRVLREDKRLIVFPFLSGISCMVVLASFAVSLIVVTLISLVSSTLSTILLASLYLYAAEGTVPGQFDAELLEGAFRAK
jgi:hypothetical protein